MLKGGKFTVARKKAFLAAYREEKVITLACEASGIPISTYSYWKANDKYFERKMAEAVEVRNDFVRSKMMAAIEEGDTSMIKYYLDNFTDDAKPIDININGANNLTKEELQKELEARGLPTIMLKDK